MKVHCAVHCCLGYHRANSKKSTLKNYEILLAIFNREFGDRDLESITSDEIMSFLSRTRNRRIRLMLKLMARGGMRVGEVLKIRAGDVIDQKIILQDPKSGKEIEAIYIPKKVLND